METTLQARAKKTTDMHPITERLEQFMKHMKLNTSQLAAKIGYDKPERLHRLFRVADVIPSTEIILDVTKTFGILNIEWLMTGKGTMLKEDRRLKKLDLIDEELSLGQIQEIRTEYAKRKPADYLKDLVMSGDIDITHLPDILKDLYNRLEQVNALKKP